MSVGWCQFCDGQALVCLHAIVQVPRDTGITELYALEVGVRVALGVY